MGRVHLNNCWIVEHSGKAIGVIVQDRAKFTFHAAVREVWSLDRQIFPTYYVYENSQLVQSFAQSAAETFIALGETSQRRVTDIH